jgi:hypothetical protein
MQWNTKMTDEERFDEMRTEMEGIIHNQFYQREQKLIDRLSQFLDEQLKKIKEAVNNG